MEFSTAKEQAFQDRENQILKAAFTLFMERGIEATTMDRIAEVAQVGKGTIYKHVTKKNDILALLIIHQSQAMLARMQNLPSQAPVLTRIKAMIRTIWEFHTQDMQIFELSRKCRQILVISDLPPALNTRMEGVNDQMKEIARDLFQEAMDEEIFRHTDAEHLVLASMGLYMGMLELALEQELTPSEELYEVLQNMIFRGFMA